MTKHVPTAKRQLHQTTLRFDPRLWEALTIAADAHGIAVADLVRQAVTEHLVRLSGDPDSQRLGGTASPVPALDELRRRVQDNVESANAVTAQAALAITRSEEIARALGAEPARESDSGA
jgi:hypothetical protein